MISAELINNNVKYVLHTNGDLYIVDLNIYNNGLEIVDEYLDMSRYWGEGSEHIHRDVLFIVSYQDVKISKEYFKYIVPMRCEHPDYLTSLYYKFKDGGIEHEKFKGYYYIPYVTSMVINRQGGLISLLTGRSCSGYYRDGKYPLVRGLRDYRVSFTGVFKVCKTSSVNLLIHRLLALAFLDYFDHPDKLVVNHKDGNKNNYSLDNLEWCYQRDNTIHAYSSGLRGDNIPVMFKDYKTGNVYSTYSISNAGRILGVGDESIRYKLINKSLTFIKGRYTVKYQDDDSDWLSLNELLSNNTGYRNLISLKNIYTNEIIEVLGSDAACKIINMTSNGRKYKSGAIIFKLRDQLIRGVLSKPINGYLIWYSLQDITVRDLTPIELELFKSCLVYGYHSSNVVGCVHYINHTINGVYPTTEICGKVLGGYSRHFIDGLIFKRKKDLVIDGNIHTFSRVYTYNAGMNLAPELTL